MDATAGAYPNPVTTNDDQKEKSDYIGMPTRKFKLIFKEFSNIKFNRSLKALFSLNQRRNINSLTKLQSSKRLLVITFHVLGEFKNSTRFVHMQMSNGVRTSQLTFWGQVIDQ